MRMTINNIGSIAGFSLTRSSGQRSAPSWDGLVSRRINVRVLSRSSTVASSLATATRRTAMSGRPQSASGSYAHALVSHCSTGSFRSAPARDWKRNHLNEEDVGVVCIRTYCAKGQGEPHRLAV